VQAITLLKDTPALESALSFYLARVNHMVPLKPLAWEATGTQIYLPLWKEHADEDAAYLEGVTPRALPKIAKKLDDWADEFPEANHDARRSHASDVVGAALAVVLHERGWKLHTEVPGDARFQDGDVEIYPFRVMEDLAEGTLRRRFGINSVRPRESLPWS